VYWKGLEPSELLEYDSRLVAEFTLRHIDPREPKVFDYPTQLHLTSQHRHAAVTTSNTRLAPQLRLLRQIGSANDNFNNSSRLETSWEQASNYSVTSSARSTTNRNQLRLVGSIDKSLTDQNLSEVVQPRTLSALEEDFDHLPPLEEGEATTHRGAVVSDNYLDSATHVTQGPVRGSDWSGRFGHRKRMTPSRSLKSSPPQFIATPSELPFQEGRPLPPSDDEDKGQVVQSAKCFTPNREVLMIHAEEDCEGLEQV
jgi:hypothetical protein